MADGGQRLHEWVFDKEDDRSREIQFGSCIPMPAAPASPKRSSKSAAGVAGDAPD